MPPQLSEDEVDDLLYFARAGDLEELCALADALGNRDNTSLSELLPLVKDSHSGNGPVHMAAANGHSGKAHLQLNCGGHTSDTASRDSKHDHQSPCRLIASERRPTLYPECAERSREHGTTLGGFEWTFKMRGGSDRRGS